MKIRVLFFVSALSLLSSQGFSALLPSPAARAMVPRSQPTSWSLPHRVTIDDNNISSRRRLQVDTKRQSKQIPWAFCPEFFDSDPKICSMCGGDNTVKGTCEDLLVSGDQYGCPDGKSCRGYYCKCSDNGGPDNSPKVTMTSVVDGQTGIVVWEPMTLDDYKSLRASTTIELTETATASQSGAGSELETVAAVVFAGGVAWYLASQNAAAGAIAFQPPTQRPEGSEGDDETCQNDGHKPDCDDCGGDNPLALCSSGSQQFCPCEEQQCPPDTPPSCGALECAGDEANLQCTVSGKLKGCQCCPADPPKCDDDQCEGSDQEKCQSGQYKNCGCQVREFDEQDTIPDPSFPPTANSAELMAQAAISLDKIWNGDKSKVPGYEEPQAYCLYGAAPSQDRLPKEYCQCGENYATTWSVAASATGPCPWSPESTGEVVTFSTHSQPTPTPTSEPPSSSPPAPSSTPCNHGWCGAPFCSPECGPA